MKRLLSLLLIVVYFAMSHAAHAQTAYQTCAFSDPTHCYGIGPGNSGQAYVSNGPSSYPSFSSSLSGVTSVGGVTVPATASVFVTGATTTTAGECLLSTTTAGLGSWATCPGGGGGTPGGSNFELQYNNSGSFGGIALGTSGQPLISDGSVGAPAFGTLNLSFTTGTLGCSEMPTFTGDVTNTNCAMVVGQINGAAVPLSAQVLGSNASRQLVAATIGSTTQVIYNQGGTLTGNSNFTWNQSSNVLNLGASTTPGTLSIGSLDSMTVNGSPIPIPGFALNSNIQGVIENHSYVNGTAAGAARIYLARSEGTISAPTIVANGDSLGTIYGIGYGGVTGNYLTGGYMRFSVDGTPSSTAMPTDWTLALAPAGSTTAATVIKAYQDAGVTIGSPTGGDKGAGTLNATGLYINGVAVGTGGTVTDGTGTTTPNEVAVSTATAHTIGYAATLPTAAMPALTGDVTSTAGSTSVTVSKVNGASFPTSANCISSNASSQPVSGCPAPTRTVTASPTVASTDMGGAIFMNVSGGGTLTIPAIGSGVFGNGQTLVVTNYSASTATVTTTPTVNSGGGCVTATGIPAGDTWNLLSNGTTLDCVQTVSSSNGSMVYPSAGVALSTGSAWASTAISVSGCTPSASSLGTLAGTITQPATACTTATFTFSVTATHGWICSLQDVTLTGAGTYVPAVGQSNTTASTTSCTVTIPTDMQTASNVLSIVGTPY